MDLKIPCAIGWCIALATKKSPLCSTHQKDQSHRPSSHRAPFPGDWWDRPKYPPTPWDDQIRRQS